MFGNKIPEGCQIKVCERVVGPKAGSTPMEVAVIAIGEAKLICGVFLHAHGERL